MRFLNALIASAILIGAAACGSGAATAVPTVVPTATTTAQPADAMSSMMDAGTTMDLAPGVRGLYRGGEVTFIHTEASDAQVAGMLTRMMGPRVETVPQLAGVPATSLGDVFVFTNGVSGGGPFGFQEDVFDSIPGDPGYSPLRTINLVEWTARSTPRVLQSVEEIRHAEVEGELTIQKPGAVVNMPILSWPGGHR